MVTLRFWVLSHPDLHIPPRAPPPESTGCCSCSQLRGRGSGDWSLPPAPEGPQVGEGVDAVSKAAESGPPTSWGSPRGCLWLGQEEGSICGSCRAVGQVLEVWVLSAASLAPFQHPGKRPPVPPRGSWPGEGHWECAGLQGLVLPRTKGKGPRLPSPPLCPSPCFTLHRDP